MRMYIYIIVIYELHANHKPKIYNRYLHIQKKKEPKHNTKDSHQITGKRSKEKEINKKEIQNNLKKFHKMAKSIYLLKIT